MKTHPLKTEGGAPSVGHAVRQTFAERFQMSMEKTRTLFKPKGCAAPSYEIPERSILYRASFAVTERIGNLRACPIPYVAGGNIQVKAW